MAKNLQEVVFEMAKGRSLRFADGLEHQVFCLGGSLAMTRNNNPHAVVLSAGESYVCDGASVVMIHALMDAQVRLLSPLPVPAQPVRRMHRPVVAWNALRARLRH